MKDLEGAVLVTGAGGFIGRCLVASLLEEGADVVAFALEGEVLPESWGDDVRVVRGDVCSMVDVETAMPGVAVVFHLAALVGTADSYERHWEVTAGGSRNVYLAAAAVDARVIVTTSICAYGDLIAKEICRETSERGAFQGPYGRAKQGQEDIANELRASHGLAVTIVRPANVYGVGSGPWIEGMLAMIKLGLAPVIGEGSGNAGLVYVDNLVDALILVLSDDATVGRTYNVCDGTDVTWRRYMDDLAEMIDAEPAPSVSRDDMMTAALANEDPAALVEPRDPTVLPLEALNLIGSDNRFASSRIRDELSWSPRVTYEEALKVIRASLA